MAAAILISLAVGVLLGYAIWGRDKSKKDFDLAESLKIDVSDVDQNPKNEQNRDH